jgi:hypothetical protein
MSFRPFRPFVGLAAVLPTALATLSLGDGSVFSTLFLKNVPNHRLCPGWTERFTRG